MQKVKGKKEMSGSILKISEAASIALHALMVLAKNPDRLVSVKEIASALDVSANHLSKVMQRLNKAGIIDSIKGYNGGFKMIGKLEDISFLEIYELFDGKLKDSNCLLSEKKCQGQCVLGGLIADLNNQVKEKFRTTNLSDFIK